MIKQLIRYEIDKILEQNILSAKLDNISNAADNLATKIEYVVEANDTFGDYATNIAMKLASILRKNPREIALELAEKLEKVSLFESVSVDSNFINLYIKDSVYIDIFNKLSFFKLDQTKRALLEFGSANPTGPLHVGHDMNLIIGDVLGGLLEYNGYKVTREYYVNDYGAQIKNLEMSLKIRAQQELGESVELGEDGYRGEYIIDMAKDFLREYKISNIQDLEKHFGDMEPFALNWALQDIKRTLQKLDISYNSWVSEKSLYTKDHFKNLLSELEERGFLLKDNEGLLIKTTLFGDDKDRCIVKQNGETTYFASDMLYTKNKVDRNFNKYITLLGADHHGYVVRYLATFKLNGCTDESVVKLTQIVSLLRNGEAVRMSKRAGNFYTLEELVDEVGKDACRIFFISKRTDTPNEFDIALAKENSSDNPCFYLQYAYARICSLIQNIQCVDPSLSVLSTEEEKRLIKKLDQFREFVDKAASELEPYKLFNYAYELATLFHSFYNNSEKIYAATEEIKKSKIAIAIKVKDCLLELFKIFKIEPLEYMSKVSKTE